MSVGDYNRQFSHLSRQHQAKDEEIRQIVESYGIEEPLKYWAYAVLGTYGAGKTQFLFSIHKFAIEKGIIPLYVLSEDLFKEVLSQEQVWTPGSMYSLVEDKLQQVLNALRTSDDTRMREILDPRGKLGQDAPEALDEISRNFAGKVPDPPRVILLVDELEGQYGNLQNVVQTGDRSPLREWLESKTHLKILAFAPAGIYELGGADRDRVKRIVLPSADVGYIRENLVKDAGQSNSCWWLSRGKARQLFKCIDVLAEYGSSDDASQAARIIRQELDPIGQPPTEVPPAVIDRIRPSLTPFLLHLSPITAQRRRRYVIRTTDFQSGMFADRVIEAFGIGKENAMLISEYFVKTVEALSDEEFVAFVDEDDLPELLCLVLDHFLEYEHGEPELARTFGEILGLYERARKESAAVYGILGRLWDLTETEHSLPLSIPNIREVFPFPTMNPIVKNHIPDEMKRRWEGGGRPVWMWRAGTTSVVFCASSRDLQTYSETDQFRSLCLLDGNAVLVLAPSDEELATGKGPFLGWLEENGKFKYAILQPLITEFLLSSSGEIDDIPGNLDDIFQVFAEDKEDVLLSRKAGIYRKALEDIVEDELPKPTRFCSESPPDAINIWGKGQLNRELAVCGIALAFGKLKPDERDVLIGLRELFKGSADARGAGDLHDLLPRSGYSTLPDDLLPRLGRKKELKDADPITRLRGFWRDPERRQLENLARTLPLDHYLMLHDNEDVSRLLEALWRVVRGEFHADELPGFGERLRTDVLPTLQNCRELEKRANDFGLDGVDFGDYEWEVKSLPSFEGLLSIIDKSSEFSPVVRIIIMRLAEHLEDIDGDVGDLGNLCGIASRALEDLAEAAADLEANFSEYRKAARFMGLTKKDLSNMAQEQTKMSGVLGLDGIAEEANERKGYLELVMARMAQLEDKLGELGDTLAQIKGGS